MPFKGIPYWKLETKDETAIKISQALKGRVITPEWRAKISAARTGQKYGPFTEEHKRKISEANRGKKHGPMPEFEKLKRRIALKGKPHSPEWNKKVSFTLTGRKRPPFSEEWREKLIQNLIKCRSSPNKKELLLDSLLKKNFPSMWKYVGDGKVLIEGFNPDWINCNGTKQVLELFGCYYHGCPIHFPAHKVRSIYRESVRSRIFASYGYAMLVIWEHELKHPEVVIEKIRDFSGGG